MSVYPQIRTSADLLKSTIRIEALIPFLQQQKAEACAIVNSKLYGLLPFWHAMKQANIHPVVGLVVRVEFTDEVTLPVILYAQNNVGYAHLLKISSSISIRKEETLPFRWLAGYAKGCIAVLPLLQEQAVWLRSANEQFAYQIKELFGDRLLMGISRNGKPAIEEELAIALSQKMNSSIMAIHESTFLREEDHFAYEVARAIYTGVKIGESLSYKSQHQYVLSANEWHTFYSDHPEWLQQTRQVLLNCQAQLHHSVTYMPKFPIEKGQTADEVLQSRAIAGLQFRLGEQIPPHYLERLQYEIGVICSMGYADYFLIVEDFMRFAKESNILTGPGRGSSASSLVAYALQITQVDPLQYDLLFERFLNPQRISLPDIDIDFVDTKRHEVIKYVANKYGKQYVAQIITFGTLSAKAVARDVARMFNFDSETLDQISKMIPNKNGITLQEAYTQNEKLRAWIQEEDIRSRWFDTALKLEGLPRNSSTHAAGVVLSPVPLVEVVPIEEGHDDIYLTQWPMQEVEQAGLLKMDFLGLRNLTILEQLRKSIQFTHHIKIDFTQIPLHDEKTFSLLREGDTAGIFQLESEGMRQALREIKPTHFLDIVAVNALYRPGPMDFIPIYARRKHGMEQVVMPHPALEPILRETYGVIVYQEQIMRIANVLAGFSIGEADLLRRAVSKKKRDVLEQQRAHFIAGAKKQGYAEQTADEVYALIVRFADYGFPKSHAVAYSLISYQLAYLKAHFPVNFYAALLTNATGNQDKVAQILMEAKSKGIVILPPSIQKSSRHFKVENGQIRYSLSAIKNVSQPFLQKLMAVRDARKEPFEDIFDLAISLSAAVFNRKTIEPLIKAGALDEFGKDRGVLLATIEAAIKQAEIVRPNENDDLFSTTVFAFGKPKHVQVEPIPDKMKLQFEKDVLGFYLSEHPITKLRNSLQTSGTIQHIQQMKANSYVKLLGIVEHIRVIRTKQGQQMAFVELQDEFGSISVTLFPQLFETVKQSLAVDRFVYVEGIIEPRLGKIQVKVKHLKLQ